MEGVITKFTLATKLLEQALFLSTFGGRVVVRTNDRSGSEQQQQQVLLCTLRAVYFWRYYGIPLLLRLCLVAL